MEPASDAAEAGGKDGAVPAEATSGQELPAVQPVQTVPPVPPVFPVPGMAPGVPSLKDLAPSILWGAALPIAVFFTVRHHVNTDAQALMIAGGFSVTWIVFQFVRQRRIDLIGVIVLFGFIIGVTSSILLGGNSYVLKVREAFFTALFGAACIITVFTHERPTLFYLSRYLSAGNDPAKVSAYNRLMEFPTGKRTFQVLSIVWGIGLLAEAAFRMVLAEMLHTGTFLAVSPLISFSVIGSLFAFTVVYSKRVQLQESALIAEVAVTDDGATAPAEVVAGSAESTEGLPQIPLP